MATIHRQQLSIEHLDHEHAAAFSSGLSSILSTDLAFHTMAQLVDGLPTATVARRTRGSELGIGHPIYHHEQICDAAIHKTKEFRDNFDPLMLCFDDLVSSQYPIWL